MSFETPEQTQPHNASRSVRIQRILFWSMLVGIVIMALLLLHEHNVATQRYANLSEITPLTAPYVDTETITFDMADDTTGSITAVQREIALPQNPTIRARALLDRLFIEYALPQSAHPLPTSAAIDELFLVDLPVTNPVAKATPEKPTASDVIATRDATFAAPSGRLAIVSLRGTFVQTHPSGLAVEDLTLRSIIGTLHANFPDVQQVRFLVDGQPADTLAGHADLARVYTATDTASSPTQPSVDNTSNPTSDDSQ